MREWKEFKDKDLGPVAAQRKELYDKYYIRMDGRTDVDLGGARRTGGSRRRD
jgi:hypothetical protein